jgi:hypothetical protein
VPWFSLFPIILFLSWQLHFLLFLCTSLNVNSYAQICLVFNKSIRVIVTKLPFVFLLCKWQCHFWCLDFLSFHFNTSIRVIVTMLPCFKKLFNMSICVIVTVFPFVLSPWDSQIFHATQASLVLHRFLPFSFSKLGLKTFETIKAMLYPTPIHTLLHGSV